MNEHTLRRYHFLFFILNLIQWYSFQDSIQGSKDVSVIFGMSPCSAVTNSCPDAASSFGQVIYGAPYRPQLNIPENSTESESFTVPVPVGFRGDKVVLSLAHVVLIGVSRQTTTLSHYVSSSLLT